MSWHKIVRSGHFKRKVKRNLLRITTDQFAINTEDEYCEFTDGGLGTETTDSLELNIHQDASTSGVIEKRDSEQKSPMDLDEGEIDDFKKFDFSQDLKEWALKYNIRHVAIKDLLKILNKSTEVKFPRDPRTFLVTPCKINVRDIEGGQYWHNGLTKCLQEIYNNIEKSQNISININIDGLPIFNSSKYEFWPILFNVNEISYKPMIIGIYYGKGKPCNPNEFLSEFVEELLLILNNGVMIGDYKIHVQLKCFICDSPARSFVKGVANFNSQHGCQKCTIVGEYSHITHSNYYPNKKFSKRTDEEFRLKKDEYHHKTNSLILKLPINMIDCFPVADSLHLIDLGVMKRMLTGWRDGTYKNKSLKWPAKVTEGVSKQMLTIKLPKELHRATRGLDVLTYWKGLEYRNFLLYIGITILRDVLAHHVYEHFLGLFCAITICSTDFYSEYLHVAETLLDRFVHCYSSIYGEYFITSNIHNLTHLIDDVKVLGNLTKFSAYPFESKLYEIKNMIRNGNKPLAQIANRLSEKQCFDLWENKELPTYPCLKKVTDDTLLRDNIEQGETTTIFKTICFEGFCLGGSDENRWFLTKQNEIVYFEAVARLKTGYLISGKKIEGAAPFFLTPINSTFLNIYIAKAEFKSKEIFRISDIKCKLVHVIYKDQIVFVPLLHTLSK